MSHDRDIRDRMLQLDIGKKLLMSLYLLMLFFLFGCGLLPAAMFFRELSPGIDSPGPGRLVIWVLVALGSYLIFNYGYLLGLLALRIVIPKPKAGTYPNREDGRPPNAVILFMINVLLTKLRYNAPFAGMLPGVLVKLPPLALAYRKLFGPDTPSTNLGDTCRILDPYLIKAGKNVQFGFGSTILAHFYDNRGLMLKPVEVEDCAVIGGDTWLCPGVKVGHHALVGVRSVVYPDTVIGPYEYWRGNPAKKVKDLQPGEVQTELLEGSVRTRVPETGAAGNSDSSSTPG